MEYYLYKFPLVLVVPVGCVQRVPVFLSKPEPSNWTIYKFQKFCESESLHWSASTSMYYIMRTVFDALWTTTLKCNLTKEGMTQPQNGSAPRYLDRAACHHRCISQNVSTRKNKHNKHNRKHQCVTLPWFASGTSNCEKHDISCLAKISLYGVMYEFLRNAPKRNYLSNSVFLTGPSNGRFEQNLSNGNERDYSVIICTRTCCIHNP